MHPWLYRMVQLKMIIINWLRDKINGKEKFMDNGCMTQIYQNKIYYGIVIHYWSFFWKWYFTWRNIHECGRDYSNIRKKIILCQTTHLMLLNRQKIFINGIFH